MFCKKTGPQEARFLVVSKTPAGMPYLPGSSITPALPDMSRLCQVVLRFDPRREHHHPDDNDLRLTCAPQLFDSLREGAYGIGLWEEKTLLAFTPCE